MDKATTEKLAASLMVRRIAKCAAMAAALLLTAALLLKTGQAHAQNSIVGVWSATVPGLTSPISVRIELGPNGRFQQDTASGPTACEHSMLVGNYGALARGTYRFDVYDYVPKVDCLGKFIAEQPGWTVQLQLISPTVLMWRDLTTTRAIQFVRAR